MKSSEILVIDLFAGPGGLGEGFASCITNNNEKPFKIGISIEKEASAHKTLTTRSLFRKLIDDSAAKKYYFQYIQGKITRDQLFAKYPYEAELALTETLEEPRTLGKDNKLIHKRIKELVKSHKGPKIVIGGPPCQAYSLAGRSRNVGNKNYIPEDDQRQYLYKEYLEIISIVRPEVFVMENVRGILSAKINNQLIFPQILADLKQPKKITNKNNMLDYKIYSLVVRSEEPDNPEYKNLSDFLIRAENYSIPQARHRVILLGVRNDIKAIPSILQPSNRLFTVKDILDDLPQLRSGFSKQPDKENDWFNTVSKHTKQIKRLFTQQHEKEKLNSLNITPIKHLPRQASTFSPLNNTHMSEPLKSWLLDYDLNYIPNHETRGHIAEDLMRYSFCSIYALLNNGRSPKSRDFPIELAPAHTSWVTGKHADRFRVQSANKAASTITSHISKDGHFFIHYDPKQCRSLTVREAARLQTFPDNYFFEGNRTEQYVQVGNAVPPFLAYQISYIVLNLLETINA